MKFFNKRRLKIVGIIISALIVVYFALLSPQLMSVYRSWNAEKNYAKWEESIKEQYRNDTYGGDTPEETWGMFVSALEDKDFDLASKYFVLDEQKKWRGKIDKTIEDTGFETYISELKTLEKDEVENLSQDKEYYSINYFNEEFNDIFSSTVVFYLNPYSEVWKILEL